MSSPNQPSTDAFSTAAPILGHLEITVLEILWDRGESNVHEVVEKLDRPLAYTTVMTTLDRLFKKGLLERRKSERAFFYSPRLSRHNLNTSVRATLWQGFFAGPKSVRQNY